MKLQRKSTFHGDPKILTSDALPPSRAFVKMASATLGPNEGQKRTSGRMQFVQPPVEMGAFSCSSLMDKSLGQASCDAKNMQSPSV